MFRNDTILSKFNESKKQLDSVLSKFNNILEDHKKLNDDYNQLKEDKENIDLLKKENEKLKGNLEN